MYGIRHDERLRLANKARHVTFDDDYENVIYDPSQNSGLGDLDYKLKESKNDALTALYREWIEDGNLYGQENKFLDVLNLSGITDALKKAGYDIHYEDPNYREEKVYHAYLGINNPFETANVSIDLVNDILEWWGKQNQESYDFTAEARNTDLWDKRNITVDQWINKLLDDIENGTTYAWTVIPDAITDYLKEKGYDGIKDTGGKQGGETHIVYVPFESEQVKSADLLTYDDNGEVIPLSQRFTQNNADIRYSRVLSDSEKASREFWTWMGDNFDDEDDYEPTKHTSQSVNFQKSNTNNGNRNTAKITSVPQNRNINAKKRYNSRFNRLNEKGIAWVEANNVLEEIDWQNLDHKLYALNNTGDKYFKTDSGVYIIPTTNALIFTDGKYDERTIFGLFRFYDQDESKKADDIEYVRSEIEYGWVYRDSYALYENARFVEFVCRDRCVKMVEPSDYRIRGNDGRTNEGMGRELNPWNKGRDNSTGDRSGSLERYGSTEADSLRDVSNGNEESEYRGYGSVESDSDKADIRRSTKNGETYSKKDIEAAYNEYDSVKQELTQAKNEKKAIESSEALNAYISDVVNAKTDTDREKALDALNKFETESGYTDIAGRVKELQSKSDSLRKHIDDMVQTNAVSKERYNIEKSGLSESEYFAKQAVKEFGYRQS